MLPMCLPVFFSLSIFHYFIDWMELFCTILYILYSYWLMIFSVRGLRKMLVSISIWRWWECTSVRTQVDICIYIYIQTQEQPCLPSTFLSTSMLIRIESQKRSNSRTWTFDEICIWRGLVLPARHTSQKLLGGPRTCQIISNFWVGITKWQPT